MYKLFDLNFPYNSAAPQNQAAAKAQIKTFLCPSHPYRQDDPLGYGQSDYMPIAYTDIDPVTGVRNPRTRADGFLRLHNEVVGWTTTTPVVPILVKRGGSRTVTCVDGSSSTIAIIEDVGKNHELAFPYMRANYLDPPGSVDSAPGGRRNNYRWAEPDVANGVSGPSNAILPASRVARVNNYSRPMGGPPECSWSVNNCGPNDEPFGFHPAGVLAVFGDGHVALIKDSTSARVLRFLCDPADGQVINNEDV